ncbi:MAG: serine/threonine protein kinase [Streptomyces sp.]|uniref:serine/threonine-protein kinase n=1 Tax=Streptomyces sp. TaxID=1931 RepID=UPI0025E72256|nr:serine/threonine-protein kinase [Streptomyces sp.]MBW8798524.1 serine/threonine protein kinase [Streptomyces sp.]
MRSPDPTDPPAVGGYPLLARLGEGGMGQVFLSRTSSGRPLALKTVRSELGLDPGFEERFAREIASSDQVRSPWTVSVVDYSAPGQRPQWLATEYVAAPTLADWVHRHGPLPEAAVLALGAELAEGLRAVHRAGLAHRDVKPSNVLLGRHHPLLIDFGIARAADDTRHTRTGGVIGSPGYMAPEQVTGGAAAEPGDVFALAAVLVYAATGAGPFLRRGEEPSAAQLLYRIVHEEPRLDGVPPSLLPVLAACLHKAPQSRPTAQELLEQLGTGSPEWVTVPPPGLAEDLAAREAELRALLEASTATVPPRIAPAPPPLAPAPPGFGPAPVYGPPTGSGPFPPAARSGPGRSRTAIVAVGVPVVAAAVAVAVWWGGSGDGKATGGTTPPATPSPSASPSGPAAADALPASWVGTWQGTGPGSTAGDGVFNARTTKVSVTLTLHAAERGDLVGRQVSHVTEAGSGDDIGCTETLRLQETHETSMVFQAVTSTPTDPSLGVACRPGNVYTLSKEGSDTLALGDEGSQTVGSPTRLERVT